MNIKDSVALVTGGASGLGEATVREFVQRGGRAVIVDLNEDRAQKLAGELGDAATFVKADVSNADDVQAAVDAATAMGSLRAAVSCAGIGVGVRTIDKTGAPHDLAAFQKVISVNLVGTFNVLRLAASAMSKNKLFNMTSNLNGGRRAMVPTGVFERLMPQDFLPTQLLRALLVMDTDTAQALGALELAEEDLGLVGFACPAKYEYGMALRDCLTKIEKEG